MNRYKLSFMLLVIVLVINGCANTDQQPINNTNKEFPESEVHDATIIFTVKGVRNTVVLADYIAKYSGKKETFARNIKSDFYDEDGMHTSYLVADSGWIEEEPQSMEVLGNVMVVNEEGIKLETESLRWDPNLNKIITDDFVKITRGNDILTGYGLQTDQNLHDIEILKDVKGQIEDIPEEDIDD
ncbi:MAG: LPS export ABC transporter periplasmic protein LptC [candidate division Zixibacteria bacterium]|nr:LPS export ABC transporter periplasmic protein LptC [candidate division Zixibacteria bacterium]